MNIPKKNHEPIRQNGEIVKKSQKHDVNLRKNSSLYFQIGLIVCLLASYGFLEMKFETIIPEVGTVLPPDDNFVNFVPEFKPEAAVVDEPVKQKRILSTTKYIETPNDTPDAPIDAPIAPTVQVTTPIKPGDMRVIDKPDDSEPVSFEKIEQVPIFPGCENKKSNEEKRQCMSDKINQLIQKRFNTNLGSELGLHGKQVIRTQFKIDKTGHVNDIKVRGTHPELEAEAQRVINTIPKMTPGKQRDKNVGVIYTLPIVFEVQD